MSSPHREPGHAYFEASVRDLTPASASHAARVLYAPVSKDAEVTEYCRAVLSEHERQRAHRFAREDDRFCFIQRRAFRRFCGALALGSSQPLEQIRFEETATGRPCLDCLAETWFSFSSCRLGFIGVWSSSHAIGVDLEESSRHVEAMELAREYFSPAEAAVVESVSEFDRRKVFLLLWSLKEAALKSIGEGLPFGLDTFRFELMPTPRVIHAPHAYGGWQNFGTHIIEGTGGCAALVTRELN